VCLKRAKETESLQQKQTDIITKQKDAKQLILEANDRLLKAAANQNTTDLMAAQALDHDTDRGTQGAGQPNRASTAYQKTESEMTFITFTVFLTLSLLYVIVPACFAQLQYYIVQSLNS